MRWGKPDVTVASVARPPAGSNIRSLIAQALEEAREEFAEIVQRKLEALMGDREVAPRRPGPERKATRRAPAASAASSVSSVSSGRPAAPTRAVRPRADGAESTKRARAPESYMADLRARVLSAMPVGEPLKRARIVELARVDAADEPRVAGVLRKLKDEGILAMQGTKASAVYTRKG